MKTVRSGHVGDIENPPVDAVDSADLGQSNTMFVALGSVLIDDIRH